MNPALNGTAAQRRYGPSAFDIWTKNDQDAWLDGIQAKIHRRLSGAEASWSPQRSPSPLRAVTPALPPPEAQAEDTSLHSVSPGASAVSDAQENSLFGESDEGLDHDVDGRYEEGFDSQADDEGANGYGYDDGYVEQGEHVELHQQHIPDPFATTAHVPAASASPALHPGPDTATLNAAATPEEDDDDDIIMVGSSSEDEGSGQEDDEGDGSADDGPESSEEAEEPIEGDDGEEFPYLAQAAAQASYMPVPTREEDYEEDELDDDDGEGSDSSSRAPHPLDQANHRFEDDNEDNQAEYDEDEEEEASPPPPQRWQPSNSNDDVIVLSSDDDDDDDEEEEEEYGDDASGDEGDGGSQQSYDDEDDDGIDLDHRDMDDERDELEDSAVPTDQPAGFNIPYHPTDDLGHFYVPYSGEHLSPYGDAAASHHSPVPQSTVAWNESHLSHSAHSFASSSFDTTPVPFHDPSTSFQGPSTSFPDPSLQVPSLGDSFMDFSQPMAPGMVEAVLSQLPHHEASFLFSDIPIDPALDHDTFPLDPALADNFHAALPPLAPIQPDASSSFTVRSSYAAFVEDEEDPEAPHVVISETTIAMEVENVPQPPAEAEIEELDNSPEVEEPSVEEEPKVEEPQSELSHHIPEIGEPEIEEVEDDDDIGEPEIEELDDSSRTDSTPATPSDVARQQADETPAISPSPAPSDSTRQAEDEAPVIGFSPGHVATPIGGDEDSPIDVSDDDSADEDGDDAEASPVSADAPSDSSPEQTPDLQVFDGDDNVATPRAGDKTAAVVPPSSVPETTEGAPDVELPLSAPVQEAPQAPPATVDDEPPILADHLPDSDEPIVVESDSEEDEEPATGDSSEESEPIETREPSEETEPIESQGSVVAEDDDEPMVVDDDQPSTPPTPSEVDELATRPVTPADVQDRATAPSESSTEPEEEVEVQPDSVPLLLDSVDEPEEPKEPEESEEPEEPEELKEPEEPEEPAEDPAELDQPRSPVLHSAEEPEEPEEPVEVDELQPPPVLQLVESDEEPEELEEPAAEASETQEAQQSHSRAVPLLVDAGEAPEEPKEPHSVLASPQATITDDHSVVEPPAVVVVEGSASPEVDHSDEDLVLDADSLAPPVGDGSAAEESTSATEDESMDVDEQEVDELDDSRFPTPGPVAVPESAPEPVAEDTTPSPAISPEPVPGPALPAKAAAPAPAAEAAPMAWKHFHGKARPPPPPEVPREAHRSEPEVTPVVKDDQPLDKEISPPADAEQPQSSESSGSNTPTPVDTKPEPPVESPVEPTVEPPVEHTDNTKDHPVEDFDKEPQAAEPTTKRAPRKSRLSVPSDISPPTTRSRCHPRKVQIDDGDLTAIVLVPQCCVPGPDKLRAEDAKDLGVGTFDEAFEEGRALAFHLTPVIFQKASRLFGISVFNEEDIFVLSASEGVIEERPTRERRLSTNRTPDPDWREGTPLRAGSSQPSGRRHRRGSSIGSFTLARTPDPEGTPIHSGVGFLSSQGSTRHRKRASTASIDVPPLDPATLTPSPSKRLVTFKEPDTASIRRSARKSAASLEPPSPAPSAPKLPKASGSPVIATRRVTRSMETAPDGEPMVEDEAEPPVDEEPPEVKAPPALGTRTRKRKLEPEPVVKEEDEDEETEGETPVRARSGKRRAVPSSSAAGKPEAQDVKPTSEDEAKGSKGSWSLRGFFGWKK